MLQLRILQDFLWELPKLVVSNLFVCNFYKEALFGPRVCKPWLPNRGSRLPAEQRLIRRLFVTCGVFTRYFFVAFRGFSWLFRGPLLSRKTVFGPFSLLFRGFFVAFSWLFRGPRFGQILRVLALEQSSELNRGKIWVKRRLKWGKRGSNWGKRG